MMSPHLQLCGGSTPSQLKACNVLMSNTLLRAVELAQKLPASEQEVLGSLLLDEMQSDKGWSVFFEITQSGLAELAKRELTGHEQKKLGRGSEKVWFASWFITDNGSFLESVFRAGQS